MPTKKRHANTARTQSLWTFLVTMAIATIALVKVGTPQRDSFERKTIIGVEKIDVSQDVAHRAPASSYSDRLTWQRH